MELTLDQALQKGIEAHKAGKVQEADRYYTAILKANPKHPDANHNMGVLAFGVGKVEQALPFFKTALETNPKIDQFWLSYIDALIKLERMTDAKSVFDRAKSNGAKGQSFDKLDERLGSSTSKNSNNQELSKDQLQILINLYTQGKYQETLNKGSQLLEHRPYSINLYNIIGAANQGLGKLEKAIEAYKKALSIKPDYADAYSNIGVAFKDQGKLEEAIAAFNKALSIKPDHAEALVNASALRNQLADTALITEEFEKKLAVHNVKLLENPKLQIQQAVRAFLSSDQKLLCKHLRSYARFTPASIAKLKSKDQVFCSAYNHFLEKLIEKPLAKETTIVNDQTVFHLGESHCLSYAHKLVKIHGTNYTIKSRITFGGKAYHFSVEKEDVFKAITKANFHNLPEGSKVFLSFGEIDCRPNEGFISAASKLNRKIEELVSDTTIGYVAWFAEQNHSKNHSLFFLNVPAPIYNDKYSEELNRKVTSTIKLFNSLLRKTVLDYGFNIIDVYKFTVGKDRFSNGLFHIDNYHISSDAIPEIEKQIGTFL